MKQLVSHPLALSSCHNASLHGRGVGTGAQRCSGHGYSQDNQSRHTHRHIIHLHLRRISLHQRRIKLRARGCSRDSSLPRHHSRLNVVPVAALLAPAAAADELRQRVPNTLSSRHSLGETGRTQSALNAEPGGARPDSPCRQAPRRLQPPLQETPPHKQRSQTKAGDTSRCRRTMGCGEGEMRRRSSTSSGYASCIPRPPADAPPRPRQPPVHPGAQRWDAVQALQRRTNRRGEEQTQAVVSRQAATSRNCSMY